jgi:hypothetical protein
MKIVADIEKLDAFRAGAQQKTPRMFPFGALSGATQL